MVNIIDKDGIIILEGDYFDLKIDNNRKIYVKKKNEKLFNSIDEEVEYGMSAFEKKKYLHELYTSMKERLEEQKNTVK